MADSATNNPVSESFTLDDRGNVTGLTERTGPGTTVARTIGYDGLDRVTGLIDGSTTVQAFAYNSTGDRTSKTTGSTTDNYIYASTSHRLTNDGVAARSYDANGNTTAIGTPTFVYDERNRLRDYKANGSTLTRTYRYNGRGERVSKTVATGNSANRYFMYDEAGNLLGEYLANGTRVQEYVWLDDTLVAVLGAFDGKEYHFVETDHLGTPRAVIHPTKNTVEWRWDLNQSVFGEHAPIGDPDGDSLTFELNLRYPGQYFDAETGMHYNYFRDYDPATGRYVESDPIGLYGGISTYGYVDGNPVNGIDPSGLASLKINAYRGYGGSITLGYDNGHFFARAGGVGLGGGIKFYPNGKFPSSPTNDCDGSHAFIGSSGSVSASLGPASAELKAQAGLLITKDLNGKVTKEYIEEKPKFDWSLRGKTGWGLSLGGGVNIVDLGVSP